MKEKLKNNENADFTFHYDFSKIKGYYDTQKQQGHAPRSWYKNLGEEYGTPLSEIIGKYKHIHPEDRTAIIKFIEKACKGIANKFSQCVRILRENSNYSWTYINLLVKKYAPQDNIIKLITINYDITE